MRIEIFSSLLSLPVVHIFKIYWSVLILWGWSPLHYIGVTVRTMQIDYHRHIRLQFNLWFWLLKFMGSFFSYPLLDAMIFMFPLWVPVETFYGPLLRTSLFSSWFFCLNYIKIFYRDSEFMLLNLNFLLNYVNY